MTRASQLVDPGAGPLAERALGASVVALVAHARAVPSRARESLMAELSAIAPGPGLMTLHTCHRVEAYLSPASFIGPLPTLPAGTVVLRDADAVRHLAAVACGLESAVIGETQILSQLREAYAERRAGAALDTILDRLFQAVLHAGRVAHSWYSGSPRSLADVALDRIDPKGPPAGSTILVVGAGRMGRLTAWATRRRGGAVVVMNRSAERASGLAAEVGGLAVPYDRDGVVAGLPSLDGVVLAIDGEWPVGPADMARLVRDRIPVVDLSSPPAMPAMLAEALGPRAVSVDDLAIADTVLDERLRRRLDRLISETGRTYCDWIRTRTTAPTIQAVVAAAERMRQAELEWARGRFDNLSDDDLRTVEQMSHRLVASILHAPLAALGDDASGEMADAARTLFRI